MSGLRESKKAATRTALSRSAAQLALSDGPDGLTVSAIAASADVSTRTFHNYFASREEALIEFISDRIQALVAQLDEVPQELDALSAVEHLVVEHLKTGDSELDSFGTLFRLNEILGAITPAPANPEASLVAIPLLPSVRPRFPELDDFEATVAIQIIASAIRTALEWFYSTPEPRDPEVGTALVHRACRMINLKG